MKRACHRQDAAQRHLAVSWLLYVRGLGTLAVHNTRDADDFLEEASDIAGGDSGVALSYSSAKCSSDKHLRPLER